MRIYKTVRLSAVITAALFMTLVFDAFGQVSGRLAGNVKDPTVSPSRPFSSDWSRYVTIGGAGSVWYKNKTPYTMTFHVTVDREIAPNLVASASYIASLGRHLLTVGGANPGIPATCLSLSRPEDVAPGTPTCGPFGENSVYTRRNGTVVSGARAPFDNNISSDAWYANIGNSNYNGLELNLKRTSGRVSWFASYTFSKSLDQSSSIQEQVYPFNFHKEYGISAFDLKHNFVVNYSIELPFETLLSRKNRWTEGWALSGITRFGSGLPVTFASFGDNALVNVQNNGVNSVSIDLPDYTPGNLRINHNPRNGREYFNTSLFTPNTLRTPGTSSRRFFYGPGIENFDTVLRKLTNLAEGRTFELRLETFNTFNHAQFFGSGSVDGNINSPTFVRVLRQRHLEWSNLGRN